MNNSIIIILALILFLLLILNHIKNTKVNNQSSTTSSTSSTTNKASCSQTKFGCCPDGINSKINYYGTNCPGYNPGPGYNPINPYPPGPGPLPPKPIGGCSGTRYGCCPNSIEAKIDTIGSNC